jgi:hypothetical protein
MKEIKEMYDRAREEMHEHIQNPNLLEEKLLLDDGLKEHV